ncbi:HD-GYP domain-containing protein [Atribacter laminatus]|uniref:3'3'-cGAMP-specific phosphodiesterase 3 n=1 Tax=Atribacter laminatus TaxID=2847778 RepID=A0A7T1F2J4_ATRLM|nr:HD-GYP domain-containing protein [Atribacter laminatus]QPM67360.1 3'3'-cGAMP-specific phosphodiesterase 3 [Atribacter laminatus]
MKSDKKKQLLNLYIYSVIICGIALFLYSLLTTNFSHFPLAKIITFLVLIIVTEALPIHLSPHTSISVSFAIIYAFILLTNPYLVMIVTFIGNVIIYMKTGWQKSLFNGAQFAISAFLSGYVFQLLGGYSYTWNQLTFYIAIVISILVFFLSNAFLVVMVISLSTGIPIPVLWKKDVNGILLQYFGLFPYSLLLYLIYLRIGYVGLFLFLFPLMIARYSFKLYVETKKVHLELLRALTAALDAKDPYTQGHSDRVAKVSLAIAEKLNLSDKKRETIEYAALLHDVGKIGIEDAILRKPGPLTEGEYIIVKQHPVIGFDIVSKVDFLKEIAGLIRSHHERCNGSGYPDGKKQTDLPIESLILAVADVFEALTSDRPYRKAYSVEEALTIMENEGNQYYDMKVINALKEILQEGFEVAG